MKKRILSMVLVLCVVLGMMPVSGFAAETDNLCDHHTEHTADCGNVCEESHEEEPSEEPDPVCTCETKCAEGSVDRACAVCVVDLSGCTGSEPSGPVIIQQPTDDSAKMGERFCVTVEAQGDGLSYQWYFRNAGSSVWRKSGVTDNTYDDVMTKARAGREIYCVITDAWGNTVTTEIVTLICTENAQAVAMN